MFIKVCGITRLEDAIQAIENGATAIGFIFHKKSPRYINIQQAKTISENIKAPIKRVGVFVNASTQTIQETVLTCKLDVIQLHGDETPNDCNLFTKNTLIKALTIKTEDDIESIQLFKNKVEKILLDTYDAHMRGGTGKTFNWDLFNKAKVFNCPLILAGGLNKDNIKEAIVKTNPDGIDISSGLEIEPGIKSKKKIKEFFNEINNL